jgi:ribosome-binding protein aMBF1 (putative translation factor)
VVFRKKTEAIRPVFTPQAACTQSAVSSKPAWKIEQQVDSDAPGTKPLTRVSPDDAQRVVAARTAAKLTQKQLAARINVQPRDIQEVESGRAIENRDLLARIRRSLGMR